MYLDNRTRNSILAQGHNADQWNLFKESEKQCQINRRKETIPWSLKHIFVQNSNVDLSVLLWSTLLFSCLTDTPGKFRVPPAVGIFSVLSSATRILFLFLCPSTECGNVYFLLGRSTHHQME